jgi:hypothetical protein
MPENEGQEPTDPTRANGEAISHPGQEPNPTPETPAPTDPAPKRLEALTVAELAKMVKDLRAESASYRTKLSAFEREEEARKEANLSALEKAQQTAQAALDARTALEAKLAKRDALSALKTAGVIDPDLAFLAIKDGITIEDGEPTNVDTLVAEFIKARPKMVASAPATVPDTRSTNPAPASATAPSGRIPGRI